MIDPQNLRALGIGGSDVGAIFGVDDRRDAFSVWAAKKGGLPPMAPNDRMLIGKALEPGVLTLYTHVTGREVEYCDVTSRHPERPWMVYTPDALCIHERRGVDAKVVAWDQRRKWGAAAADIPEGIQLQMWWYMAALDYEVWDVAALLGYGLPQVYEILRDQEAERVMLARIEEFWQRYILGDEIPPMGASPAAGAWLQQAFPEHKRADLRPATHDEVAILEEYAQVRVEEREVKEARAQLENQIKLAIGEREGLTWPEGKFTWRKTKGRVQWESVARGLFNQFLPDQEQRALLLDMHTSPGTRRIWFDSDLIRDEAA